MRTSSNESNSVNQWIDNSAHIPRDSVGNTIEKSFKNKNNDSGSTPLIDSIGLRRASVATAAWTAPPRLPAIILEPDIAQLVAADSIQQSQEQQLSSIIENLKSTSENLKAVNKEKTTALENRYKKVLEEIEKQNKQRLASDIAFGVGMAASILAVIGAGLLTFITAGAAAPALIGAVVGACTTIMDGVDRALQDSGVKFTSGPLAGKQATASLSGLIGAAYEAMMVSNPEFQKLPEEEKQKIISGMQIAVTVATSVMLLGISAGSAAAGVSKIAADGAKLATDLSAKLTKAAAGMFAKAAEIVQVVADAGGSAATISASAYGIQLAFITFEKNELDNQRQQFEALAEAVLRLISTNQECLETMQDAVSEFLEGVSNSIDQYNQASRNIIVNA